MRVDARGRVDVGKRDRRLVGAVCIGRELADGVLGRHGAAVSDLHVGGDLVLQRRRGGQAGHQSNEGKRGEHREGW